MLGACAWALCTLLLLALACYHADRVWVLTASARELWRASVVAAAALVGAGLVLAALLRPLPDRLLAAHVERRFPSLRERLLTSVEMLPAVAADDGSEGFSVPLARALLEETHGAAAGLDFRRAVDRRPLARALVVCALVLSVVGLDALIAPAAFAVWLSRMAHPRAGIAPFFTTRVWLAPSAEILPRGAPLAVRVETEGAPADHAALLYRPSADRAAGWTRVPLAPAGRSGGRQRFQYAFPAVDRSLDLRAEANDGRSDTRDVTVEERPAILSVRLTLHFPYYMRRPPQTATQSNGNILAPVGTRVDVAATANKPLRSCAFSSSQAPDSRWLVHGANAVGSIYVRRNGVYSLRTADRYGFEPLQPERYEIRAVPDQTPAVHIQRPAADLDLVPGGSVPLDANATDDYAVVSMHLGYSLLRPTGSNGAGPAAVAMKANPALPGPDGSPQAHTAVRWHIASSRCRPGDVLSYEVTATDNDTLNGPHVGHSTRYRVLVVSVAEMQARLKQELDEEAQALARLRSRQAGAQSALAAIRPRDRKALSSAEADQRSIGQEAQNVADRMDAISAQLRNNELAAESELGRRDEARRLVADAASQRSPVAVDAMQRAETGARSAKELAQASKEQSGSRRDIEQAQQLLARTPTPDQLAELAARIAKDQDNIAFNTRSLAESIKKERKAGAARLPEDLRNGPEIQRRQQSDTTEDTKRLERDLKNAAQASRERGDVKQAAEMSRALRQIESRRVAAEQQTAMDRLRRSRPDLAAPPQQRAAEALKQAASTLQQLAAGTHADTPSEAADRLEQAAEKLRQMAERQRETAEKVANKPGSAADRALGSEERKLRAQAQRMQPAVANAPGSQMALSESEGSLGRAAGKLDRSNPQGAQPDANSATEQLSRAAEAAAEAARQLRQQQKAAALREAVQRLAEIQHALGRSTHRIDTANHENRTTTGDRSELQQIARRQRRLTDETRNLRDNEVPSLNFRRALERAEQSMSRAATKLYETPPDTGAETQVDQAAAARTLDAVAEALKQQAEGGGRQGESGRQAGGGMSPDEARAAAAMGDIALAQGLQQAIKEDTGELDAARRKNADRKLNDLQRQLSGSLATGEHDTQFVTEHAARALLDMPDVIDQLKGAHRAMGQAKERLSDRDPGDITQQRQQEAIERLRTASARLQQAERQRRQQSQSGQMSQQGAPVPMQQHGNTPDRNAFTRLESAHGGPLTTPEQRGGRPFGSLAERAQRTLEESQQERVPAEFQPLVDRYYRSLAEKRP
jgi:hypothetical protein